MNQKTYIGDSVYVATNGYELILTTENGIETTNEIILDPITFRAIVQFVRRIDNQNWAILHDLLK